MADAAELLDGVKGVGPATRDAVLARFPGLTALSNASVEELTEIKGVGPATARAIKQAVGGAMSSSPSSTSASDPRERLRAGVEEGTQRAKDAAQAVGAVVRRTRDAAAERLPKVVDDMKERLPKVKDEATERLSKVRDEVVKSGRSVADRVKQSRKRG